MSKRSKPPKSHWRLGWKAKTTALACALALIAGALTPGSVEGSAQGALRQIRQQRRSQKRAEKQNENKLTPSENSTVAPQPESATAPAKTGSQPAKHSLDGIRERGMVDFFRREERELVIPGFGRPPAYLILMRQLDLTDEQKQGIKALRQRIGTQLVSLRQQHARLDQQLEDAIYLDNYDPKRIEELAAQTGEKQAEVTKLLAGIEAQFREILTPDQFFVYRFLVGEMLLPQRRQQPLRPQQQRRLNQQNRQNQQPPQY